jgi:hypothetical protein
MSAPAHHPTGGLAQARTPAASRQCPSPAQPSAPVPYCETAHLRPTMLLGRCAVLERNFKHDCKQARRVQSTSQCTGQQALLQSSAWGLWEASAHTLGARPQPLCAPASHTPPSTPSGSAGTPLASAATAENNTQLVKHHNLDPQSAAAVHINTPSATGCLQASAPPSAPGPWYASA